jgi:transcriptional regulator with AAA-type ATPase domain
MSTKTETLDLEGARREAPGDAGLVTLFAIDPSAVPEAVVLSHGPTILGRDPPPGHVTLPFTSVSRLHARVMASGAEITVEDLESRNGTFVNGARVTKATLQDGDELRVGDVLFKAVAKDAGRYVGFPLAGLEPPPPLSALRGGALMESVRREILLSAKADLSVLVLGETGTGKELVARALHDASARSGPLSAVNCAAIPSGLLESELFGHKRGAFTGADRDRRGMVQAAHGGTLFLDEIGDMSLEAQAKVLRVIETRTVTPVGGRVAEAVDVRIVCATHRPLARLVRDGLFRADLFARISGHTLRVPPLRERKEDIHQLAHLFLARAGGGQKKTSAPFMLGLLSHDWPFNVRELEAAMKRVVAFTPAVTLLDAAHVPFAVTNERDEDDDGGDARERDEGEPPRNAGDAAVARAVAPDEATMRAAMQRHAGNVAAVARELGKDRAQIHRWLRRYALSPEDFRKG